MSVNCLRSSCLVLNKKNMETQIEIHKIKFNSLSDCVIINGNILKGILNSELILRIQHSVLNKLLNRLQEQNPNVSINDFLHTFSDHHLSDYEFNFESLRNKCILSNDIKKFMTDEEYRFIRA